MIHKCTSCGKFFVDHLGLIGTCRNLQTALAALRALQAWSETDELVPAHIESLVNRTLDKIGR